MQLAAVLLSALLLRLVFYSGFFGSDEVTYVDSAFKLLDGDWSVSTYVGANRYGVNLPIALFGAVFGRSEWSAAAYSIVCSIGEVLLVAVVGRRLVGDRASLIAALLLAVLPTHVHLAGRLLADSPLALSITASFLYFFDGEIRHRPWSYFVAGCAAGFSFWVKQATIFYLLTFLIYPLIFRKLDFKWGWMVLGFSFVVAANCMLFYLISNDALFMFKAMASRQSSGYLEAEAAAGALDAEVYYYVDHLFRKIHHTWLLGHLALLGALLYWWKRPTSRVRSLWANTENQGPIFIAFWAVALIGVMSCLVVSWRPLMFIPKQTNYMLMFTSSLALLAGTGLALVRGKALAWTLAAVVVPSIALASLQQSTIQAFTANSKSIAAFASSHPGALVFTNANAMRAVQFSSLVRKDAARAISFPVRELLATDQSQLTSNHERIAILDETTLMWSSQEPIRHLRDVPSCWIPGEQLKPLGLGIGWQLAHGAALWIGQFGGLPGRVGAALLAKLSPGSVVLYRVPNHCG